MVRIIARWWRQQQWRYRQFCWRLIVDDPQRDILEKLRVSLEYSRYLDRRDINLQKIDIIYVLSKQATVVTLMDILGEIQRNSQAHNNFIFDPLKFHADPDHVRVGDWLIRPLVHAKVTHAEYLQACRQHFNQILSKLEEEDISEDYARRRLNDVIQEYVITLEVITQITRF